MTMILTDELVKRIKRVWEAEPETRPSDLITYEGHWYLTMPSMSVDADGNLEQATTMSPIKPSHAAVMICWSMTKWLDKKGWTFNGTNHGDPMRECWDMTIDCLLYATETELK